MASCFWRAFGWLIVVCIAGCSQPVREDRTIHYSGSGDSVAFQHGEDGVFLASPDGSKLEKIFDASDSIAVSSPLFSPDDDRLLFTSAVPDQPQADGNNHGIATPDAWDASPEGRRFYKQSIVYTCWSRNKNAEADEAGLGNSPEPLFTANLGHPGYIAANLAVRWHPDGKRLLFLDQTEAPYVSLFEFEIDTQKRRQIFSLDANEIVFDWSAAGKYLTCSVSGTRRGNDQDGLWFIGRDELDNAIDVEPWSDPKDMGWQHVAASASPVTSDARERRLNILMQNRPVWAPNDERMVFLTVEPVENNQFRYHIRELRPEANVVRVLHSSDSTIRDIYWAPNGERSAFVERSDEFDGQLRFIDNHGSVSDPINDTEVRKFAGWNHDGTRLAYVSTEPVLNAEKHWALLISPIRGARDRVFVADGVTGRAPKLVHEKLRITFPLWSPHADEMSLWGTFSPTHRSQLSVFIPWALPPGDPAATLDITSGKLRWMAVNSHEQSQVGHYYLLKQDYEEAWRWYEKSRAAKPELEPLTVQSIMESMLGQPSLQSPAPFEFYCLWKLNRKEEAAEKLSEFKKWLTLQADEASIPGLDELAPEQRVELEESLEFFSELLRASFMTEVFLSLDAASDGIVLMSEYAHSESENERFFRLICQSQMMLVEHRFEEYASHFIEQLIPFLNRFVNPFLRNPEFPAFDSSESMTHLQNMVMSFVILFASEPLASEEFVGQLSQVTVLESLAELLGHAESSVTDEQQWFIDRMLVTLLKRLQDEKDFDRSELLERIQLRLNSNPVMETDESQEAFAQFLEMVQQIRSF